MRTRECEYCMGERARAAALSPVLSAPSTALQRAPSIARRPLARRRLVQFGQQVVTPSLLTPSLLTKKN